MNTHTNARSGGQIFVAGLLAQGVDTVYCVPGESYLDILNALYDVEDRIRVITCRHEAGAAHMAEAYGKLTGRPGVCMVTRGPGACHASIAVHCAMQNSTPMILVVGQVARGHAGREAFQEVDYGHMFGTVAKHVEEIRETDRIPEVLSRSFTIAMSGRAGPVVLPVPEDMLCEEAAVDDPAPVVIAQSGPTPAQMQELAGRLRQAQKPMLLIGGPGIDAQTQAHLKAFVESWSLQVCCSFRRQDAFDNTHPNYCGHLTAGSDPALGQAVKEADLLLVVGARLDEITTQKYTLLEAAHPGQTLVHVHPDVSVPGKMYPAAQAIIAHPTTFLEAARALPAHPQPGVDAWCQAARKAYEATLHSEPYEGALDPAQISIQLRDRLDADAIITMDAGNFCAWPMRYLQWRNARTQLASQAGAMGCAVPLAIGASLLHPQRQVVCFVGDGGFMMSGMELATAVQYGATPICLVYNNGMYGTIRMHQEREYPERTIATDLSNPDFTAMGQSLGCHAERVETTDAFLPAFERALASGKAAVLEIMSPPDLIKPGATIADVRPTRG